MRIPGNAFINNRLLDIDAERPEAGSRNPRHQLVDGYECIRPNSVSMIWFPMMKGGQLLLLDSFFGPPFITDKTKS